MVFLAISLSLTAFYQTHKKMPLGTNFISKTFLSKSDDVKFLSDLSFESSGTSVREQIIFDDLISHIEKARNYILIDMFLFNNLINKDQLPYRALSSEVCEALLIQKKNNPKIKIDLISDPINEVYGGIESENLNKLRNAGINVIITNLDPLRDSNFIYSSAWRMFIKIFGNSNANGWLPNPFSNKGQKVGLRSYLALANFKANHRKVFMADQNNEMVSMVLSANPHDGSSAHSNVAIKIYGDFWQALWLSESAVANMSGAVLQSPPLQNNRTDKNNGDENIQLELITENQIEKSILEATKNTKKNDRISMALFYLGDRDIIEELINASNRGVEVKIILDPNKDAFGYKKPGIPNRQVASELLKKSKEKIEIRWYDTHGEQFHSKLSFFAHKNGPARVILGSANLTRRNLDNFNLESNVSVIAHGSTVFTQDVNNYFKRIWNNQDGIDYTVDYSKYQDDSLFKYLVYRVQEGLGLGSF